MTIRVLFVCLGNICRSPMAEGIFERLVEEAGLSDQIEVDSAGTGSWHVGESTHPETRRILAKHGIVYSGRARQLRPADLASEETYIIAMDQSNVNSVRSLYGHYARLYRLMDFASAHDVRDVPDPYYTGDFEYVYQLVEDGCRGLLEMIRKNERI